MANVTTPPILDSTGQAIADALDGVAYAIAYGEGTPNVKASYEESPALYSHSVDDIIYYNNHFYKVTSAISPGNTLTIGTNITASTGILENSAIFTSNLPVE